MVSEREFVDGAGWISDESDFHGSSRVRSILRKRCGKAAALESLDSFAQLKAETVKPECEIRAAGNHDSSSRSSQTIPAQKVSDCLYSRSLHSVKRESDRDWVKLDSASDESARNDSDADHSSDSHSHKDPAFWQPEAENILNFLRRLPVEDRRTNRVGPWLWVRDPGRARKECEVQKKNDLTSFIGRANTLLEAFKGEEAKIKSTLQDKAQATITKKLKPHREQLEDNLVNLAVETGTTYGKWMLFPSPDDLPRTWRLVAEATAAGKLGPATKVATHDPSSTKPERVICVYTFDFTDIKDVRRVLHGLAELGLCGPRDQRGIFYKADAWTYMDFKSDNPYRIKASFYSSRAMLKGELPDGVVGRMLKR
ncbi:hypothetical protein BTJ68_05394 [Hortaea werneckii EXF-2000]|uniref:DUF1917 domain-containing protein n=2 Tax=Hortaea werneckii TaxID=91943 RepID=A0A3M7IRZ5_HORWE|nr:hypothetical protein BTJ68_05394 [Hortaea werneckii EXF-2000]RMZ28132.1 hypothetical protein D0859_07772 [Hortaea werneckii]